MGPMAREGFPYCTHRGAYVFVKDVFQFVFVWNLIYAGPYRNLPVATSAIWHGKASHKAPIDGPICFQKKRSCVIFGIIIYRCHCGNLWRCPMGPMAKAGFP